jgi:hypothetical protein
MEGKINIDDFDVPMDYYLMNLEQKSANAKNRDVNLIQDWICDKVSIKNAP